MSNLADTNDEPAPINTSIMTHLGNGLYQYTEGSSLGFSIGYTSNPPRTTRMSCIEPVTPINGRQKIYKHRLYESYLSRMNTIPVSR
jgi:hypothetical protein